MHLCLFNYGYIIIYIYILLYRTSGLLVLQEVPNVKCCQRANVTGSLKFKGQVRKELKILNIAQYRVHCRSPNAVAFSSNTE